MVKIIYQIITVLSLVFSSNLYAGSKALEIMQKVEDQSAKITNQKYEIFMQIENKQKKTRDRFFELLKQNNKESTKSLIKFYRPANIKNTKLLTHNLKFAKHNKVKQWVYFPAYRVIKKISGEEKNKSFMGSDFSYSDISGRSAKNDNHQLLKTSKKYYLIESKPKES